MGKFFDEIPEFLVAWIQKQQVFYVASAPLDANGHVNVSTKACDGTFHIVNARKVWYEDLTGSGVETISHLRENGRITILFNAFEGPPRIARLFGKGTVYEFGSPEYESLLPPDKRQPGSRAVIMVDVHKVGTSCGYSVPFFEFKRHRTQLGKLSHKLESNDMQAEVDGVCDAINPKGMRAFWAAYNSKSIDGLLGLTSAPQSTATHAHSVSSLSLPIKKAGEVQGVVEGGRPVQKLINILEPRLMLGFALGAVFTILCMKLLGVRVYMSDYY